MTDSSARVQFDAVLPETYKRLLNLNQHVGRMAEENGVEPLTLELVKIRASQINGCAFCTDLHVTKALELGEGHRRLSLLTAWRETTLFTDQERAAFALAESGSTLSETRDVPDDVYAGALKVFTEEQVGVVVWAIAVINAFNVLNVTGRKPLPEPS